MQNVKLKGRRNRDYIIIQSLFIQIITKKKNKKRIYMILFILLIVVPTVGQGLIDRQLLRKGEHKQAVMINK